MATRHRVTQAKTEKVAYQGWPNCYRLSNDTVDLVVTSDIGPRIMRYGFTGGDNQFREAQEFLGKMGGEEYRSYGGHRLWHAPENKPRTYQHDNAAVQVEELPGGGVRLRQPVEPATGIQKEMEIRLSAQGSHVHIFHRLHNRGLWEVETAPWALSVMAPGGMAIVPLPPRGKHPENLLPTSSLVLWAYTDLSDPRWYLGKRYVALRQDPKATVPQKIGMPVPDGWAAYLNGGRLFVKKFGHHAGAVYPDMGSSFECFTGPKMLEMESLAPLGRVAPGSLLEHEEHWYLYDKVALDRTDDDAIDRVILPLVREAR
jgi:hypothetical protein